MNSGPSLHNSRGSPMRPLLQVMQVSSAHIQVFEAGGGSVTSIPLLPSLGLFWLPSKWQCAQKRFRNSQHPV